MKSFKDEERVMELEYNLICDFIKLRGELGLTQKNGRSIKYSKRNYCSY